MVRKIKSVKNKKMLTKNQIDEILNFVYTMPENFYECQKCLDESDITAAMELFRGSETFKAYFATVVNLGDFGPKNNSRDIYAMAYSVGIDNLKMIICSYFIFIKSPKKYKNFGVNLHSMMEFNAKFLSDWSKLLAYLGLKNQRHLFLASYALILLIICEIIFLKYPYSLKHIVEFSDMSFDRILQRRFKISLFEVLLRLAGWDVKRLNREENLVLDYFKILLSFEASTTKFFDFGIDKITDISVHASADMVINIKKALRK